jgi:MFS family permease
MGFMSAGGLLGLYFTIPAGMMMDMFGTTAPALLGLLVAGCGYVILSFMGGSTWVLMVVTMMAIGFSSGLAFMCMLGIGIRLGSVSVSIAGASMSASITATVLVLKGFVTFSGCTEPDCWKHMVQVLGCCILMIAIPASVPTIATIVGEKFLKPFRPAGETDVTEESAQDEGDENENENESGHGENDGVTADEMGTLPAYPTALLSKQKQKQNLQNASAGSGSLTLTATTSSLEENGLLQSGRPISITSSDAPVAAIAKDEFIEYETFTNADMDDPSTRPHSLSETLNIFKYPYFYVLLFAYFSGVASGLIVLTSAFSALSSSVHEEAVMSLGPLCLSLFGIFNMFGSLLAGWIDQSLSLAPLSLSLSRRIVICGFFSWGIFFFILSSILGAIWQHFGHYWAAYALVASLGCVGVTFGSSFTYFPILTSQLFGNVNFGKYFGYVQLGSALASIVVPLIVSVVEPMTGVIPFFVAAAVCLSVSLPILWIPMGIYTLEADPFA